MARLKSGREIELKPLTIRQKFKMRDDAMQMYNKTGLTWSYEYMLDLVESTLGLSDEEVEKQGWTGEELDECAAEIIKMSQITEIDKKK